MSKGKKRFWSDEEKREICGQARVEGASVAKIARRYAMNANLIHKWLRDPRYAPPSDGADILGSEFLAVEVAPVSVPSGPLHSSPPLPVQGDVFASRIDLTLSDGRRILIEGPTALSSIITLVQGLRP